jgi:hypothetical protein
MSHAMNDVRKQKKAGNGVGSGELVRVLSDDGFHCSPDCPFLAKWDHPFWHHTAWCSKMLRDLTWHDYWLPVCDETMDAKMEAIRSAGRTKHPNKVDMPPSNP